MQHCNGMYKELVSLKYRPHKKIFTDGSKQLAGVGAAAVVGDVVRRCSLPGIATILTAELMAIRLALNYVAELEPVRVYGLAQRDDLHRQ